MTNRLRIQNGEHSSGECFLTALLNNKPLEFKVDTGANFSFIGASPDLENLPTVRKANKSGASGSVNSGDVVKIDALDLAERSFANLEMRRYPAVKVPYLGMDILGQYPFSLDFVNQIFSWTLKSPASCNAYRLSPKGHILLSASTGSSRCYAMFDTGAELTCVDNRTIEQQNSHFEFIQQINNGTDINNSPVAMKLYRTSSLKVDGIRLEDSFVIGMDFSAFQEHIGSTTSVVLGFNHISSLAWSFNTHNKTWWTS